MLTSYELDLWEEPLKRKLQRKGKTERGREGRRKVFNKALRE